MRIELFCVEGCPNVPLTMNRLKAVLQVIGVGATITRIVVRDNRTATELRFLGSPTVRINGTDIEPSSHLRKGYGLMCRTYPGSGGVPSEELLRSAVIEATARVSP